MAKHSDKPYLRALAGEAVTPPPVWLMRQAGRYLPEYRALRANAPDFIAYCLTPDLAIEVTLQPIRRYGFDAAILFADILLIPFAIGQQVAFEAGEGPVLTPIRDAAALDRLTTNIDALEPVMQTVAGVAKQLPPHVALIGFAGAPWTVATYMIEGRGGTDHEAIRKMAWNEPALFDRLLDRLVTTTADYLSRQVEAGAEALQLFESWAGSVPAGLFERGVIRPTRRIVELVRAKHPDVPIIGFPRAAGSQLAAYAEGTGVDAVGIDHMTDLATAASMVSADVTLQGNLDPVLLQLGGSAMRNEIDRIVASMQGRPFIFNLGHGVMQTTPPEHVAELLATVRATRKAA